MRRTLRWIVPALLLFSIPGRAHKPITSKYTYTEDVFPIVNARCGRCHMTGGVAPMSLLTYKEAIPWAESMRVELTADHMPSWYVDNDSHRLSSRELDILLTWATGGTPEGPSKRLTTAPVKSEWKLGKPDLILPLPNASTLGPDTMEDTVDVALQTAEGRDRWIRALDVLPGTPAIVRSAMLYSKSPDGETVMDIWFPGDDPMVIPSETAFRWTAGAELRLRIHYKKTWTYDGKTVTDRTSIGVYLTNQAPKHELHT